MSKFTDFLKLFKWDTKSAADLEEDYDIDTAVNPNWDKIDENAIIVNERLNKLENNGIVSNKYARALPGQVRDASFAQIYADSPVVDGLEIKGKELTQKTRDDKNKFTTTFIQNGTTRIKSGILNVDASEQYVFSAVSTLGHPLQFAVSYFTAENTLISSSAYYNNGSSFTTPANTSKLQFQVRDFENSGVNNTINVAEVIEPQLELGTTKTAYQEPGASPSIEHPSEIENLENNIKVNITGKNFIGYKENGTITKYGLTINYNNGIFTINGTANRDSYLNLTDVLSLNIYSEEKGVTPRKLYKNKYNLGYKYISGTKSISNTNLAILDKIESPVNKFYLNGCHLEDKNLVINITESLDYYMYLWIKSGTVLTDFKFAIQLEVGENTTEMELYKNKNYTIMLPENKFLGEFKGCRNYIKNNKLYNNLKILTLTGEENWVFSSPGYNLAKVGISNINAPYNSTNIMCNYFKVNTGTTAVGEMRVGTNYLVFNYDDGAGGVEAWKSFLQEKYNAGDPVIILYVTNTEEEEELPTATQTILNSIELYEDINNISVDGGTINFKYNKSLARAIEELYILAGATQESEVSANEQ